MFYSMSYLAKARKEDLRILAEELGFDVQDHYKIVNLRDLIITDEKYNEEFTKGLLDTIIKDRQERNALERKRQEQLEERKRQEQLEERKRQEQLEERKRQEQLEERKRQEQIELEERKRHEQIELEERKRHEQIELEERERERLFELEKLRIQSCNSGGTPNPNDSTASNNCRQKLEIHNLMLKFDADKSDISLYLVLFERQARRAQIEKEFWVSHLLGLLPSDMGQLIAREDENLANDYDHVKSLLLKRYKMTPEKFRQLYVRHSKKPEQTWSDFGYEIRNYFHEWIAGLEVTTFDDLCDLMVTDQMKRKVPTEIKDHFIDEWGQIKKECELVSKLDDYESARSAFRKTSPVPVRKERPDNWREPIAKPSSWEDRRWNHYPENANKFKGNPNSFERRKPPWTDKQNFSPNEVRNLDQKSTMNKECNLNHVYIWSSAGTNNDFKIIEVKCEGKVISSLFDTGSLFHLIREDAYEKIGSPPLDKNFRILAGIGGGKVTTRGSFSQNVVIDNRNFTLEFHVVPLHSLRFEMVIGIGILKQSTVTLSKEGTEFHGIEEETDLIHLISDTTDTELELCHVTNIKTKECVTKHVEALSKFPVKVVTAEGITPKLLGAQMEEEEESSKYFMSGRGEMRDNAKKNILEVQNCNLRSYDRRRKKANQYKNRRSRGYFTSTAADFMKPWAGSSE